MKKAVLTIAVAALFTVGAWAQAQPQNQQGQTPQEKASGIGDQVDITSAPQVENLTGTSATLKWTTNKNAATRVRYGTDEKNPAQHAFVPGGTMQHSAQLTDLKPNTTYHYEIETQGGKDRAKGSFQTPAK